VIHRCGRRAHQILSRDALQRAEPGSLPALTRRSGSLSRGHSRAVTGYQPRQERPSASGSSDASWGATPPPREQFARGPIPSGSAWSTPLGRWLVNRRERSLAVVSRGDHLGAHRCIHDEARGNKTNRLDPSRCWPEMAPSRPLSRTRTGPAAGRGSGGAATRRHPDG